MSSFRSTAGASWNTRDTGSQVLSAFSGPLDDELVTACSPLDSQHAPDEVAALVFQLLGNLEELAGDLELVIGVKPHSRHVDVTEFACDQVLNRIHVLLHVIGNTPRSGLSAHALAALTQPGHSSHHNVLVYREMRQSPAATAGRSVGTTIGVDAL